MAGRLNLASPATPTLVSPAAGPLASDLNRYKGATVFPSHVRRTFQRFPTDYTGELVRLLDDLSTATHSIAAYITEGSENLRYGETEIGGLDPKVASKKLYRALSHDGYACMILDNNYDLPLAMPEDALNGSYVVTVTPLDTDASSAEQPMCGTIFSVYKRRSSATLPGRPKDIQQNMGDQVAAGYVQYSSATTLYYTLGREHGVYSFSLHPVARQYFLQPTTALTLPETATAVYGERAKLRSQYKMNNRSVAAAIDKFMAESSTPIKTFDTGTLVANFHGVSKSGGIVVEFDCHLLCAAGPLALMIEQQGGSAVDGNGKRILDLSLVDDTDIHKKVTLIAGTAAAIEEIAAELQRNSQQVES